MIKIEKVVVNNYKNIQNAELELNNFNVIVGANNSGKSNFLQVLSFLNFIINGSVKEIENFFEVGLFRGYFGNIIPNNKTDKKGEIKFELLITDTDINVNYFYSIVLNYKKRVDYGMSLHIIKEYFGFKNKHSTGSFKKIFSREDKKVDFGTELTKTQIIENISDTYSLLRILSIITSDTNLNYKKAIDALNNVLVIPTFYFSNIELRKDDDKQRVNNFRGRIVALNIVESIVELKKGANWDIFKNALKDILNINGVDIIKFPFKTKDTEITQINYLLRFRHFNSVKSIKELSDGSVSLIALIIEILLSKHDIICIEEPENSIHPKALASLIDFIRSFELEKQFIITTHSIMLINKVKTDDVIIATIDKNGMSTLSRVSD